MVISVLYDVYWFWNIPDGFSTLTPVDLASEVFWGLCPQGLSFRCDHSTWGFLHASSELQEAADQCSSLELVLLCFCLIPMGYSESQGHPCGRKRHTGMNTGRCSSLGTIFGDQPPHSRSGIAINVVSKYVLIRRASSPPKILHTFF